MGSLTGSGEPFLGRECVHARRGRPICRRSISIFWQTADLILVHLDSESVHGVGRTGVPAVTYGRNRLWTAAGCAGSTTFNAFMAFRIINGFFSTVAQGGGVMFIK